MSNNCNDITKDLRRGGLSQTERMLSALDPDQLKLMEFGLKDWMQFAYNFSKNVLFFDTSNDRSPSGNWEAFFKNNTDLETLLEEYGEKDNLTPHLTLFICFLKLLDLSKNRFNDITQRHLDFYYEDILQIAKLEEEADKVYLLFELAKNIENAEIPAGSEFDGGKDNSGKKRIYSLQEQFIANRSTVSSLRTIYNDPGNAANYVQAIKASPVADSADGLGKEIKNEPPAWFPFGYNNTAVSGFEEAPDAVLGFAVSGNTLLMKEGKRYLVFIVRYDASVNGGISQADLREAIQFSYTTEEGWSSPAALSGNEIQINGSTYTTKIQGDELFLFVELADDAPASVVYNPVIHEHHFNASTPVFKFMIQTNTKESYQLYRELSENINKIAVKLKVEGVRSLEIESDTGTLNARKPFYPFTTLPAIGSNFTIINEEVFSKKWTSTHVTIKWQNTPLNFNEHYKAYDKSFAVNASKNWLMQITGTSENNAATYSARSLAENTPSDTAPAITTTPFSGISGIPFARSFSGIELSLIADFTQILDLTSYNTLYNSIVTGDNYFKAKIYLEENKQWIPKQNVDLFQKQQDFFYTKFSVNNTSDKHSEGIRMSLLNDFLHSLYPTIYALALSSNDPKVLIPNQPYTPFAEYIELNYEAEDELNLMDGLYPDQKKSLHLYHVAPFGEREEHISLGKNTTFRHESSSVCSLIPKYGTGGELLIGIKDARLLQQIALLFQFLEGSENPLITSGNQQDVIEWSILCSNYWKKLDTSSLIADPTQNFLQSGIVKLIIPENATNDNTLMPPGLFWIRVKTRERFDAFCKVIGIAAQAAVATFDNRGNDISHLSAGLPADTITKMVNRSVYVKTVSQPYNSFGGKVPETQEEYYLRVSERLRHKNRAVNLWDYEHLVLQRFPEIFKIKCLNHTCDCSYLSGGNVSIVVIPNTQRKNVFDTFQPRVSSATLLNISGYLSKLNSLHVKTHVINPDYEEVKVSLEVKFKQGYDVPYHLNQLNKDIQKYLSPWAFEVIQKIKFGTVLYRSELIDYIDELPYVDYVTNVNISHNGNHQLRQCEPSGPKAILVSAKSHDLLPITTECQRIVNQTEETC